MYVDNVELSDSVGALSSVSYTYYFLVFGRFKIVSTSYFAISISLTSFIVQKMLIPVDYTTFDAAPPKYCIPVPVNHPHVPFPFSAYTSEFMCYLTYFT